MGKKKDEKHEARYGHVVEPRVIPVPDEPEVDMVNHPPHYTGYEGFEVIEVVEQLDYLRGTAVKYILRAGEKWNEREDIEKAIWYLTRYLGKLTSPQS